MKKDGIQFMDVSDHMHLGQLNAQRLTDASFAQAPSSEINVKTASMLDDLEEAIPNMRGDIVKLSSFWTRNYRSPWGLMSSNWVYDHVAEVRLLHCTIPTTYY